MRFIMILVLIASNSWAQDSFESLFTGRTMRFDYFHSGTAGEEHVAPQRLRLEGEWPGSRAQLLDETNLGKYFFEVIDVRSNRVIYSRGFSSIYGEWETTGEAGRGVWNSIHESQRFPEPRGKTQLVLEKRNEEGVFESIFTSVMEPDSRFVDKSEIPARGLIHTAFENGPAAQKVDLLFLGDGYTESENDRFVKDVERLSNALFLIEPFKSRRRDFNVRAIQVPSGKSGISNPRKDSWNSTPLGLSFNSFDSDRYVLTYENPAIREVAAQVPYDALIILANSRKYGGGGIHNLYTTATSQSEQSAYLVVHEFGHSFAGLADEYYTSSVAYEDFNPPGLEPWEPNITALFDPNKLKWRDEVEAATPLPTPWKQQVYDETAYAFQERRREMIKRQASEEEMEAHFREVRKTLVPIMQDTEFREKAGAFEGAGYRAQGLYQPEVDCIMFTRNPDHFCRVCSAAIERVIDLYAK